MPFKASMNNFPQKLGILKTMCVYMSIIFYQMCRMYLLLDVFKKEEEEKNWISDACKIHRLLNDFLSNVTKRYTKFLYFAVELRQRILQK